jgi:hypothetical protein
LTLVSDAALFDLHGVFSVVGGIDIFAQFDLFGKLDF